MRALPQLAFALVFPGAVYPHHVPHVHSHFVQPCVLMHGHPEEQWHFVLPQQHFSTLSIVVVLVLAIMPWGVITYSGRESNPHNNRLKVGRLPLSYRSLAFRRVRFHIASFACKARSPCIGSPCTW